MALERGEEHTPRPTPRTEASSADFGSRSVSELHSPRVSSDGYSANTLTNVDQGGIIETRD